MTGVQTCALPISFLDITSTRKLFGSAETLALEIKKRIRDQVHLTASIGIAPNKFIAKIASDLEKPDGLVFVSQGGENEFLFPLEISRLWGVGKKTLPLLQELGIQTIDDLAKTSRDQLYKQFGEFGLHFYRLANGIDDRPVERDVQAKSISKEVTFDADQHDTEVLVGTLRYLCNELAREMRRKQYRGRTITLKIRLSDFSTFTRSRTMVSSVHHFDELFQNISELFQRFDRKGQKVRLIGVGVSQLEKGEGQLDLFAEDEPSSNKIDDVMDKIREKFGEQSITRASLLHNKHDSQWIRD